MAHILTLPPAGLPRLVYPGYLLTVTGIEMKADRARRHELTGTVLPLINHVLCRDRPPLQRAHDTEEELIVNDPGGRDL